VRPTTTDQASALQDKKNQQFVTHFIHNQGKASQSETKLIILSSFSLDSMWSEAASHGQLASI
jgi:hypothetical protein